MAEEKLENFGDDRGGLPSSGSGFNDDVLPWGTAALGRLDSGGPLSSTEKPKRLLLRAHSSDSSSARGSSKFARMRCSASECFVRQE